MNILQFLFGKNLMDKNVEVKPGTFYLDVETKELFFDDPSNSSSQHNKVIDTGTLIYRVTEKITFPADGSDFDDNGNSGGNGGNSGEDGGNSGENNGNSTSAILGIAVLGSMTLGSE